MELTDSQTHHTVMQFVASLTTDARGLAAQVFFASLGHSGPQIAI